MCLSTKIFIILVFSEQKWKPHKKDVNPTFSMIFYLVAMYPLLIKNPVKNFLAEFTCPLSHDKNIWDIPLHSDCVNYSTLKTLIDTVYGKMNNIKEQ